MKTQNTMSTNNNRKAARVAARKANQEKALDAFCRHVGDARELATLITRFLDNHMELAPEEVHWNHTADASRIANALREITTTFNLI